jgi:hypothetical protein
MEIPRNAEARNTETRGTVTRQRNAQTGKPVLVGREEATAYAANVFGDSGFVPLAKALDREIAYEAEVRHSFDAIADDNFDDRGEFYTYRLWSWKVGADGAVPEVFMGWQDFHGDELTGGQFVWDSLLSVAVERMRRVRYDKQAFTPILVGAGQPDQKGAPCGSGEG